MVEQIMYVIVFLMFFVLVFNVLRATRFEEFFKQGRVFEIKFGYIVVSLLVSYFLCQMIDKLLSFMNISL